MVAGKHLELFSDAVGVLRVFQDVAGETIEPEEIPGLGEAARDAGVRLSKTALARHAGRTRTRAYCDHAITCGVQPDRPASSPPPAEQSPQVDWAAW